MGEATERSSGGLKVVSIGAWLYNIVAGIELAPAAPGYKHAILRPQPSGGLTFARASLDTLYGTLVSDWTLENGAFEYTIVVPPKTTATVILPRAGMTTLNGDAVSGITHEVGAGTHHWVVPLTASSLVNNG